MKSGGKRFIIDLHTQMVAKEAVSSDSEGEGEEDDEGKKRMEPDEGVLRLEGGSNEDDLDSLNNPFHWQMEDYQLFPSYNMLRVDEGKKEEGNEYPKEYREAGEGKAVTTKAKGKNIQYEFRKMKDSTVRLRKKKMLRRTTDIIERCRQQGKHFIRFAQETKRKGLIKASAVRSEGSKINNTVIDGKEWQPTKFMVPSFENKSGDMENLREKSCNLNKLDDRQVQAQWATEVMQNRPKACYDKHLKLNRFQPGQWVLKYDGRNEVKPGKFKVRWVGPYQIQEVGDNGAIKLWTLDGQEVPHAVNGSKLKMYHARKTPSSSQNEVRTTASSSRDGEVPKEN